MELHYSDKDMTVYELAQLVAPILNSMDFQLKNLDIRLGHVEENMVTKDYLKEVLQNYPTKKELREELKGLATKDDLKQYATKNDYMLMEKRLTRKIYQNYVHVNKRIDLISEKIS